jgi:hypothetical protein
MFSSLLSDLFVVFAAGNGKRKLDIDLVQVPRASHDIAGIEVITDEFVTQFPHRSVEASGTVRDTAHLQRYWKPEYGTTHAEATLVGLLTYFDSIPPVAWTIRTRFNIKTCSAYGSLDRSSKSHTNPFISSVLTGAARQTVATTDKFKVGKNALLVL